MGEPHEALRGTAGGPVAEMARFARSFLGDPGA